MRESGVTEDVRNVKRGYWKDTIDTSNGFMPCFRDDERIGETQHMVQLWVAQT